MKCFLLCKLLMLCVLLFDGAKFAQALQEDASSASATKDLSSPHIESAQQEIKASGWRYGRAYKFSKDMADGLTFKPYFSIGFNFPQMVFIKNDAVASFSSELTRFNNMHLGVGFRIHEYIDVEIKYVNMQRNIIIPGTPDLTSLFDPLSPGKSRWHSYYVSLVPNLHTPSLDLKYGTVELSVGIGLAYYFGTELTRRLITLEQTVVLNAGPKLLLNAAIVLSLKKYLSVKFGVDMLFVNENNVPDNPIPMIAVMHLTFNLLPF